MERCMQTSTRCALLFLLPAVAIPAQQAAVPLHVAFVGDLEKDRGKDFLTFLRAHHPRVDAVERKACDPARLRGVDVVILDWSQQDDGVIAWMNDKKAPRLCPLGDLEHWERPTVLIGSAGLNVAAAWNLPGAHG
jgi:hypothetical protein